MNRRNPAVLASLAFGLCLATAVAASAPGAPTAPYSASDLVTAAALRDSAARDNEAYRLVESLTTEVGPRLSGSDGDRAAVAWAVRELKRLGFAHVTAQPVMVPHWIRGVASAEVLGQPGHDLVVAALGGSVGTPESGITAPIVRFADLAALKAAAPGSLAGKIAYVAKSMPRSRDGHGYGETVDGRVDGPAVASARGAVGFLLRSVGTDHNRIAHTGITDYTVDAPAIAALAVSAPDADLLDRLIARGDPVTVRIRSSARSLPDVPSANVVGEIVGASRPGEVVLLGAHLDSWDLGEGAIDDGAGVAIVTAAAHAIQASGHAPARTIRVVLFAHEEGGGAGARAYAASTATGPEAHVAALEADFGSGRVFRLRRQVAPAANAAVDAIARVLAPIGVTDAGTGAHGGADISKLKARGVPVLDLGQDGTTYFDVHHTANDVLGAIDKADLNQVVAAYAATAWLLANTSVALGPLPASPAEE